MQQIPPILSLTLPVLLLFASCVNQPEQTTPFYREGENYLEQGVRALRDSNHATAASMFGKALVHYQGIDHVDGIFKARINLAELSLAMGHEDGVREQLDELARLVAWEAHHTYGERITLLHAGLAIRDGELDRAETLLNPLLAGMDLEQGANPTVLTALANRTRIAFLRPEGQPEEWTARFEKVLTASTPMPNRVFYGRLRRFQAEILRREGAFSDCEALLQQAYEEYHSALHRPGIASTLEEWGDLMLSRQAFDEAADLLHRTLLIRIRILDREGTLQTMDKLTIAFIGTGRGQKATNLETWRKLIEKEDFRDWGRLREAVSPF